MNDYLTTKLAQSLKSDKFIEQEYKEIKNISKDKISFSNIRGSVRMISKKNYHKRRCIKKS